MPITTPGAVDRSSVALVACDLQKGVAAAVTQFVHQRRGSIIDYDQFVDTGNGRFFARMEWIPDAGDISHNEIRSDFISALVEPYAMDWQLHFPSDGARIAVYLTREVAHLYDLLMRTISGQWRATVALIISNHRDLEPEAARFRVPYHHFAVDKTNRKEMESKQIELLRRNNIDLVVLARYMQIVTETLIAPFENRIINIHHSMLPAFVGAKPYHQAYARGVKLIGATSHYVTAELDAGPIIAQDVVQVDHKKFPERLIAMGRDLETKVLARAVGLHLNRRIWIDRGRTIIFD